MADFITVNKKKNNKRAFSKQQRKNFNKQNEVQHQKPVFKRNDVMKYYINNNMNNKSFNIAKFEQDVENFANQDSNINIDVLKVEGIYRMMQFLPKNKIFRKMMKDDIAENAEYIKLLKKQITDMKQWALFNAISWWDITDSDLNKKEFNNLFVWASTFIKSLNHSLFSINGKGENVLLSLIKFEQYEDKRNQEGARPNGKRITNDELLWRYKILCEIDDQAIMKITRSVLNKIADDNMDTSVDKLRFCFVLNPQVVVEAFAECIVRSSHKNMAIKYNTKVQNYVKCCILALNNADNNFRNSRWSSEEFKIITMIKKSESESKLYDMLYNALIKSGFYNNGKIVNEDFDDELRLFLKNNAIVCATIAEFNKNGKMVDKFSNIFNFCYGHKDDININLPLEERVYIYLNVLEQYYYNTITKKYDIGEDKEKIISALVNLIKKVNELKNTKKIQYVVYIRTMIDNINGKKLNEYDLAEYEIPNAAIVKIPELFTDITIKSSFDDIDDQVVYPLQKINKDVDKIEVCKQILLQLVKFHNNLELARKMIATICNETNFDQYCFKCAIDKIYFAGKLIDDEIVDIEKNIATNFFKNIL